MYKIAIIPGDGIGKEVMESGEYLLDKLDLNFSFEYGFVRDVRWHGLPQPH